MACQRRFRRAGLADDHHVPIRLEQAAHALTNDLMVIEQEDSDLVLMGFHLRAPFCWPEGGVAVVPPGGSSRPGAGLDLCRLGMAKGGGDGGQAIGEVSSAHTRAAMRSPSPVRSWSSPEAAAQPHQGGVIGQAVPYPVRRRWPDLRPASIGPGGTEHPRPGLQGAGSVESPSRSSTNLSISE